jgi:plasmid stabilization system protein ParE
MPGHTAGTLPPVAWHGKFATSPLADKYACSARVELPEVIDPKPGYVWDPSRQDPGTDGWGHYPKSGRAQVLEFPKCRDGRVVADIIARAELLVTVPLIGAMYPRGTTSPFREIISGKYRIFYRVNQPSEQVEILTVWHSARRDPDLPL